MDNNLSLHNLLVFPQNLLPMEDAEPREPSEPVVRVTVIGTIEDDPDHRSREPSSHELAMKTLAMANQSKKKVEIED